MDSLATRSNPSARRMTARNAAPPGAGDSGAAGFSSEKAGPIERGPPILLELVGEMYLSALAATLRELAVGIEAVLSERRFLRLVGREPPPLDEMLRRRAEP